MAKTPSVKSNKSEDSLMKGGYVPLLIDLTQESDDETPKPIPRCPTCKRRWPDGVPAESSSSQSAEIPWQGFLVSPTTTIESPGFSYSPLEDYTRSTIEGYTLSPTATIESPNYSPTSPSYRASPKREKRRKRRIRYRSPTSPNYGWSSDSDWSSDEDLASPPRPISDRNVKDREIGKTELNKSLQLPPYPP